MVISMDNKKRGIILGGIAVVALVGVIFMAVLMIRDQSAQKNPNLALRKGVTATCDSTEQEALSADMAIDGDDTTLSSRWSSENNWEDASHYIELEFPEEISVSFVILKWERRNAVSYALEGSVDGKDWMTLRAFDTAPEVKNQEIVLDETVTVRYLRLTVDEVSKREEDYSNLYQNVSLYEFEVYADKPAAYQVQAPVIETKADGSRHLTEPEAPAGYTVSFIGADLEQVIGADGTVCDTIQDKEVTVGYRVQDMAGKEAAREISFTLEVPACESYLPAGKDVLKEQEISTAEQERNACPQVIPALAEWSGGSGFFTLQEQSGIVVDAGADSQDLWDVAELFTEQLENMTGADPIRLEVREGTLEDVCPGDIYLGYTTEAEGLGEEGYLCNISDTCVIQAESSTGIRWGTVTLLQLLCSEQNEQPFSIAQGLIRDYPRYEVRGFGIDVARKAVSMDTLYAILETMSWYKMNDLSIHLNDNTILSTSGLTDSAEHAMTADSAFRLESEIENEEGVRLTSEEYAYTKEEFDRLIATAKTYGITVVPEIDTPAHSLSITKLYPEYALTTGNESVDQIDLGNENARTLVESIWQEALAEDDGAFRNAEIVNIGMDEYYGDGEQYRQFLNRINELVQGTGKTVRLWGSLSNMGGSSMPSTENLQMNIWSTVWAEPREMYEQGYSLINMQNNHLYIIPGGGYDYLDGRELYEHWEPNKFYDYNRMEVIPSYSHQMLGASYMIWNDMSGNLDLGISEYDLYERFVRPVAVLSGKLWGMSGQESYDAYCKAVQQSEQTRTRLRSLEGNGIYIYPESVGVEAPYDITLTVKLPEDTAEPDAKSGLWKLQILAESDSAYGEWAFYLVEPETGKVGFTREGRTYTFDYTMPREEWVSLSVCGRAGYTELYVNGEPVDTVGSDEPFEEHATFVFPLQRIAEETGSFAGEAEWESTQWLRRMDTE